MDPDDASGIIMFAHCAKCLTEMPDGTSPREWNRTEVGFLADGALRIWCLRHHVEVGTFRRPTH